MKAVILAAGVGQRLGDVFDKPKCLLEFGDVSLIQRHLQILQHYNIDEIIVVTGYQSNLIEQEISSSSAVNFTITVHNPNYEKGSIISMLTGLEKIGTDQDFILMDADVLYDHNLIGRLINSKNSNCFLLDRDFEPGDEAVKLCVHNGHIVDFRKQIDKDLVYDFQGESVGFFRFTGETASGLITQAKAYLNLGDDKQPYEECIRDLLLQHPEHFAYEDITGIPWIEIDFPEDVARATNEILPQIVQATM
ncbi:MAG: phosphocholine cytidylyltransferase family protein [Gammaproteobacteria bacterium]|nr:phosphocholine cytidylyltransferase family protein [Gammaproteobacteria bacterium]